MSRYGKITARMWGDEKFKTLSKPQPNGQTLWVYLLTGPHRTPLPGAFNVGEMGLAEALGWPLKGFRKAFAEVFDKGMAQADWKARLVFLPNALRHNPPESPNVVRSWKSYFDELPDCPLKKIIFAHYEANLTKGFLEAFQEAFPEGYEKDFGEDYGESGTGTGTGTGTGEREDAVALGEFGHVRLTAEEIADLQGRIYPLFDELVAELDRYGENSPRKFREYKSHKATLLNWFDRRGTKANGNKTSNQQLREGLARKMRAGS